MKRKENDLEPSSLEELSKGLKIICAVVGVIVFIILMAVLPIQ